MALITDPDDLNQGTEVTLDTSAKTITLNIGGNLSTDGVTLKALYSFLKEELLSDAALPAYGEQMTPITDESFEFINGWDLADDASRYLVRTAGWTVRNTAGAVTQQWAGIVGLGSIEADDQLYFDQGAGATDVQLTGQVNQAVQILSDPNGDGSFGDGFDRRTTFDLFAREQGQLYGFSDIAQIGVDTLAPIAYRFPIQTGDDLKVTAADSVIAAQAPYTGMSITYLATPAQRSIGGVNYGFSVIIDANGGTAEQVYEFVQYQLRQAADIDTGAGTVTGETADRLLEFVGDTLFTLRQSDGGGVFIDGYQPADINRLVFVDDTGAERTFPRKSTLTLQMGANLVADPDAEFFVYYGNGWGTPAALLLQQDGGGDVTGDVSGRAEVQISYDYDGDTTGGRTPGQDVPIVVVAQGLSVAQYVRAEGTITFPAASVALVAPLERNYANI